MRRNVWNKIVSIVTVATMIVTVAPMSAYAQEEPIALEEFLNQSDEGDIHFDSITYQNEDMGVEIIGDDFQKNYSYGTGAVQDDWSEFDFIRAEDMNDIEGADSSHQKATTAYYRNTNMPPVVSQEWTPLCGAFSSIACMEINLRQKGYYVDLSEIALSYFDHHSVLDPLGGFRGDSFQHKDGIAAMSYGGAIETAMDWCGPLLESTVPFSVASYDLKLSDSIAYKSAAHLREAKVMALSNREVVKEAIIKYGSVGILMRPDSGDPTVYNEATAALYHPNKVDMNHAEVVVGWDDNFPASKFAQTPPGNGAWIVRNSWGKDFGEDGYCYISYYDGSLVDEATCFDVEINEPYDNIYQYDGCLDGNAVPYTYDKIATIYQAHANSAGKEAVTGASFYTASAECTYTVQVYTNLTQANNPVSGSCAATITGTTDHAGVYRVDFPQEVLVNEGSSFSIVIDLDTKTEKNAKYVADYLFADTKGEYTANIYRGANDDFAYSNNRWQAMTETNAPSGYGNFRVKAYTRNVTSYEVEIATIQFDKESLELTTDSSPVTLITTIVPANATNRNLIWSSTNESVAKVKDGTVTPVGAGTTQIIAKSADGKRMASCVVTVVAPKKLSTPTLSVFNNGYSKFVQWSEVDLASEYEVEVWKDGGRIIQNNTSGSSYALTWSIENKNLGSGKYTCRVRAVSSDIQYAKSDWVETVYDYQVPIKQLDPITIQWAGKRIYWNYIDEATAYLVQVYRNDKSVNFTSYGKTTTSVDLSQYFTEIGTYKVTIYAVVADINQARRSNMATSTVTYDGINSISLSQSSVSLILGNSEQLYVKYNPQLYAASSAITWTSSNNSAVTVNSSGQVTAVGQGSATITATLTANSSVKATCNVQVYLSGEPLAKPSLVDTQQNHAKVLVWNAVSRADQYHYEVLKDGMLILTGNTETSFNYSWYIENMMYGSGTYVIRVRAENKAGTYLPSEYATFTYVYKEPSRRLSTPTLAWNGTKVEWSAVSGADAYVVQVLRNGKNVIYAFYGKNSTMADATQYFTEAGTYEARVYAISQDINTARRSNNIIKRIEYNLPTLAVNPPATILDPGKSITLNVAYSDGSAIDKSQIRYISDNEQVAIVDSNGVVTAVAGGSVTIRVESAINANIYATCTVKVPDELLAFCRRLYTKALGRDAEQNGLIFWDDELRSGEKSGAEASAAFLNSEELINQGLSNEEFINRCYATLFDREADENGFAYWMGLLENGMSRRYVATKFCKGSEFADLCSRFGIRVGEVQLTAYADQNENITMYVTRCYTKTLNRVADEAGVEFWTGRIIRGEISPKEVAEAFVFSDEFVARGYDDFTYVSILYRTFMGREYDDSGMNYWMDLMHNQGVNRKAVFDSFVGSAEFATILSTFGM